MSLHRHSHNRSSRGIAIALIIAIGACCFSCANMGRPGGGPKDETPPVLKKSNPPMGALHFNKNKITLEFDEIVQVENPNEKIIISPPQTQMPQISALGRIVSITLNDSMKANTTYTIDCGDAIADNNEKNKLLNFSFHFSTGDHIDTLEMSGILLNAADLEPVSDMLVGIYMQPHDTTFTNQPFLRMSRTDEYGRFTVRNIAEGTYRIFALKDGNRNYFFDNATEDLAFLDTSFVPSVTMEWHNDTIWADTSTIDTIITSLQPHYFPEGIILRSFNENYKASYFEKYDRTDRHKVTLYFSTAQDTLPRITPLDFSGDDWSIIEKSKTNDTITYWFRDSNVYNKDTLRIVASYLRTDSAQQLSLYNDTMLWAYRERKRSSREKKRNNDADTLPSIEFMGIEIRGGSNIDIYASPAYIFTQPVKHLDPAAIHLEQKVDTLWVPVSPDDYTFEAGTDAPRTYRLKTKWASGGEYIFTLDSLAAESIYGNPTATMKHKFKVKAVEEYANLIVRTTGVTDSAFVELLNNSDQPIYKAPVRKGAALFRYINPGTYYMRLCLDRNDNGVWDTGNYREKRQPEEIFYYPGSLSLRANWDVDQVWDVYATPLAEQKPYEIIKNKPKETQSEEETQPQEETPFYSNQPTLIGNQPRR